MDTKQAHIRMIYDEGSISLKASTELGTSTSIDMSANNSAITNN
jgi:hypothetical protein